LESDFTHPSATGGVPKVARQLLAFFKTDPTSAPWFLKKPQALPTLTLSASQTNGIAPLTLLFSASATSSQGAVTNYTWSFDDGCLSTNQNPAKIFPAPGEYHVRLTAEDTLGNAALTSIVINVLPPPLQITAAAKEAGGFRATWMTRGGETYVVQAATNLSENAPNTFTDISPLIAAPPAAASTTNYLDTTARTNSPARYYRLRPGVF
jgi:PKD repeat protein